MDYFTKGRFEQVRTESRRDYRVLSQEPFSFARRFVLLSGFFTVWPPPCRSSLYRQAREIFERCLAVVPDDKPCLLYIERCKDLMINAPENWDGIFHRTEKK